MRAREGLVLGLLLLALGCRGNGVAQPDWPELHPAQGVVMQGGSPVGGGVVVFRSVPENEQFLINGPVQGGGTFELTTVRATDTLGERKPGVPAGEYSVTYIPPAVDQTQGFVEPAKLPKTVTIQPGPNHLKLDFPAPRNSAGTR